MSRVLISLWGLPNYLHLRKDTSFHGLLYIVEIECTFIHTFHIDHIYLYGVIFSVFTPSRQDITVYAVRKLYNCLSWTSRRVISLFTYRATVTRQRQQHKYCTHCQIILCFNTWHFFWAHCWHSMKICSDGNIYHATSTVLRHTNSISHYWFDWGSFIASVLRDHSQMPCH